MTVSVTCPDCERRLNAPPTAVGKKIRCPSCKAVFLCQSDEAPAVAEEGEYDDTEASSDDSGAEEVRPRARKRHPSIKKRSSAGLWIGLAAAGAVLILAAIGGVCLLLFMVLRKPTIPDADWVRFTTPDGACSVQMPGTPTRDSHRIKDLTFNKYLLELKRQDAFFLVDYTDIPTARLKSDTLKTMTAANRDGLVHKLNGTATVDHEVKFQGRDGWDLQIRLGLPHRGMMIERAFLVPNGSTTRLYLVEAGGSNMEAGTGDAAKFFDSLTVNVPPAEPVPVPANPPMTQPPAPMLPKTKKS